MPKRRTSYIFAVLFMSLVFIIGYGIERHETVRLLFVYSLLFALYTWIILKSEDRELGLWVGCSILARLMLLFSTPNLSEDVYRFIWDGRLLASGFHPFAHPPAYYIENNVNVPAIDYSLFSKLNSKNYFTIYPPVAQCLFWISAKLGSSEYGSMLVLKIFIAASEIGSILLLKKMLAQFALPQIRVLIYALNPLVILELIGNVHFEAILIFFMLLAIYYLGKDRLSFSAISLAVSVGIKLVPVVFLPAVVRMIGWRSAFRYWLIAIGICVLAVIPLLNTELLQGFQNSLKYYFVQFEFNASLYYLARFLGYLILGYNAIHIAGPLLAAIALFLILTISINGLPKVFNCEQQDQMHQYVQILSGCLLIYYLFTTTLHPWYITPLLALTIFTSFRFVVIWTFMIFLTYAGYSEDAFTENLWIVALEYAVVGGFFVYEVWGKKSLSLAAKGRNVPLT